MEVLSYLFVTLGLFFFGISLGAIVENKRIKIVNRLDRLERTTQEILLPLANKITHTDARGHHRASSGTWTDSEPIDPEETMKLPKLGTRGNHGEDEETW